MPFSWTHFQKTFICFSLHYSLYVEFSLVLSIKHLSRLSLITTDIGRFPEDNGKFLTSNCSPKLLLDIFKVQRMDKVKEKRTQQCTQWIYRPLLLQTTDRLAFCPPFCRAARPKKKEAGSLIGLEHNTRRESCWVDHRRQDKDFCAPGDAGLKRSAWGVFRAPHLPLVRSLKLDSPVSLCATANPRRLAL